MKKIIRSLCCAVAVSMTLSLAACGQKEEVKPAENKAGTQTQATVEEKKELDYVKLNYYYPNDPQKDINTVKEAFTKYTKEKLNCDVELMPTDWGTWGNKYSVLLASGEPVDLIFTASWTGYYTEAGKNSFTALDELLANYGKELVATIDPGLLDAAKFKGKIYGIPTYKELGQAGGLVMVKEIADKYGVDVSKLNTLEDLEPILKKIKEGEKFTPFELNKDLAKQFNANLISKAANEDGSRDFSRYWPVDGEDDIAFDASTEKFVKKAEVKGYVEQLKLLHKWYQEGLINKDAATTQSDGIKGGKTWITYTTAQPGQTEYWSGYVGKPMVMWNFNNGYYSSGSVCGSMTAIGANSADAERAMMVMNLLYTDKNLINIFVNGVEGKHYVKASDSVLKLPEGAADRTATGYNAATHWMSGNIFLNYVWDNEDPEKWAKLKDYNTTLKKSPLTGFVFDVEKVKTEKAAITNSIVEFDAVLYTGVADTEQTLKKKLDKMNANGFDKVIAELQAQYDEWKKAK